jgi:hypothetical protein
MRTKEKRNSKLRKLAVMMLMVASLGACEELGLGGDREYNVYFIPDAEESKSVYVGKTTGIRNCRQLASMRRQQMNKIRVEGDYTCCVATPESDCAERKQ